MKKRCLLLLAVVFALFGGAKSADAALSNYLFSVSSGTLVSETGATTLLSIGAGSWTQNRVFAANLPFNFNFDGTVYSRVSISSNGVIGFGNTNVTTSGVNNLTGANVPILAPWWDQLRFGGNRNGACSRATLTYATSGSSPSRVFTITYANFQTYRIFGAPTLSSMQVRLYEGSNKIEFFYPTLTSSSNCNSNGGTYSVSGSIGIATSASNFISITPSGTTASRSDVTANNNINLATTSVSSGRLYTFEPCTITISGNTSEGGTTTMASGSQVFSGMGVQRGNSQSYQPFTVANNLCATRSFTYSITGTNAADYQISQNNGTLLQGESNTPTITFTPSGMGVRNATLTVTDDNGFSRTYSLVAQGSTRIEWTGNIAQGGTATVANGDTLMSNIVVRRNTTQTFTPVTIRNFNTNAAAPGAPVSFVVTDPSGQYTAVAPTSASLLAGESFSPVIRFSPTRLGFQEGTLTINAEGETRTYLLRAFGGGPGSDFSINSQMLDSTIGLFNNVFGCVGELGQTLPLTIRSTGSEPLVINSIDFFETDTNFTQGVPRLQLVRDRFGNLIPVRDYYISTQPGVAPLDPSQRLMLPDTIPAGQTRTYYITYIGQETGKRFARAFINTNSMTTMGRDTLGGTFEGILNFELFGRANGSSLSSSADKQLLDPMVFEAIRVGDSIDMTYRIFNTGACDLRISYQKLAITSGDVQDFRLLSAFGRPIIEGMPMVGDAIIGPDSSGLITVRFKPQRGGSRRATLWLQTNDSTVAVDGLYERGAYYLDIYGFGKAGIDYTNLKLRPAVISGIASRGVVRIVNSSMATVGIASFQFFGGDAAEFSEDATGGAWPVTYPYNLIPGAELLLGVQMNPVGLPGARATSLRITTTTGEIIDIAITGEAGSQGLSVSTNRMFVGVVIPAGTETRQVLLISNTGTLPIILQTPTISGPGAADYRLSSFPRLIIEPNGVEYLEVTFTPSFPGASIADLTIVSDAGTQVISLEGEGSRARRDDPDPTATLPGRGGLEMPELSMNSTSSVRDAAAARAGVAFDAVRPNPARERAEIVFQLAQSADVRIELYDGAGRLVSEIASGARAAGEHRLMVDVSQLGAGIYHCRLVTGSVELTRNVVVVR